MFTTRQMFLFLLVSVYLFLFIFRCLSSDVSVYLQFDHYCTFSCHLNFQKYIPCYAGVSIYFCIKNISNFHYYYVILQFQNFTTVSVFKFKHRTFTFNTLQNFFLCLVIPTTSSTLGRTYAHMNIGRGMNIGCDRCFCIAFSNKFTLLLILSFIKDEAVLKVHI